MTGHLSPSRRREVSGGCSGGPELRDEPGVGAGPIIVSVLAQITQSFS